MRHTKWKWLALALCLIASPTFAAPAVVQHVVGNSQGAAGNTVATANLTSTTGNLLVDFFSTNPAGAGDFASSVADPVNSTHTIAVAHATDSGVDTLISYFPNATALSAQAVTGTAGGGGVWYSTITTIEISGVNASTPLDLHPAWKSNAASNSPTITLGTTAVANEIACASIQQDDFGAGITVTESTGWTTVYDNRPRNGTPSIHIACIVLSSIQSVVYNPSFSGGATPAVQIGGVSFEAPSAAAAGKLMFRTIP